MKIKINDWFGLHSGFTLEIHPGFTAIVGPNGAGKTTLLLQIREFAEKSGIKIWEYSNLIDGGDVANNLYLNSGEIEDLAGAVMSSEGENVFANFANRVKNLGETIRKASDTNSPLIVLLDAIDSGASIDKARQVRRLFDFIYKNDIANGSEIYIIMAVNHYEFAKATTDCVNARTGEHIRFDTYESYAEFVCSFNEKFARK